MASIVLKNVDVLTVEHESLIVDVYYMGSTGFALAHNGIPVVKAIAVANTGEETIPAGNSLSLRASLRGQVLFELDELPFPPVEPDTEMVLPVHGLRATRIDATRPELQGSEAQLGTLEATLHVKSTTGTSIQHAEGDLRILAPNEWFNSPPYYESLAAFVQPNLPAVTEMIRATSDVLAAATGSSIIEGYQSGPQRAMEIAAAIYVALQHADIRYISPPASFENTGQRVRTTEEVLSTKFGTCIDLSIAYAAIAQQCGLHPVIILIRGHALVGVSTREFGLKEPVFTSPETINNYLRSGQIIAFDAAYYESELSFTDNVKRTRTMLVDYPILGMIGVVESHRDGIRPLPSSTAPSPGVLDASSGTPDAKPHSDVLSAVRDISTELSQLAPNSEIDDTFLDADDPSPARVQRWKRELLDLSLNNRLLNLKAGSEVLEFELRHSTLAELDDKIHRGDKISVLPHDDLSIHRFLQGYNSIAQLPDETITQALSDHSQLFAYVNEGSYVSYFRRLSRTTRTMAEETGSSNLYLTLGSMEYETKNGRAASAPLFLIPVKIVGGKGGSRFAIQTDTTQEASPNHSLVEWLRQEHHVTIDALSNPKLDQSGLDIDFALREIAAALIEADLPFTVARRAHLAIAKFTTYGMWRDLRDNWETFMRSPVFNHLTLRPGETFVEPSLPDRIQDVTVDEGALALPIAADGAQLQVVNAAGLGYSFVVEGPPGTGKSQTITNTLAHLMAQGKKVLFVAEKQAALDVVKARMHKVGLSPFVLDLHGAEQRPQAIREQLRAAIDATVHYDLHRWENAKAQLHARLAPLATYPSVVHAENRLGQSLWSAVTSLIDLGEGDEADIPESFVSARASSAWFDDVERALPNIAVVLRTSDLSDVRLWDFVGDDPAPIHELEDALAELGVAHRYVTSYPAMKQLLLADSFDEILQALSNDVPLLDEASAARLAPTPQRVMALATQLDSTLHDNQSLHELFSSTFVHYGDPSALKAAAADATSANIFNKKKRLQAFVTELSPALHEEVTPDLSGAHAPANVKIALSRLDSMRQAYTELDAERRSIPGIEQFQHIAISDPGLPGLLRAHAAELERMLELSRQHPQLAALNRDCTLSVPLHDALQQVKQAWSRWLTLTDTDDAQLDAWLRRRTWVDAFVEEYPSWNVSGISRLENSIRWHSVTSPLRDAGLESFINQMAERRVNDRELALAFRRGVARASINERLRTSGVGTFYNEQSESDIAELQKAMQHIRHEARQALPAIIMGHRSFQLGGSTVRSRSSAEAWTPSAGLRHSARCSNALLRKCWRRRHASLRARRRLPRSWIHPQPSSTS